ncbi:MAG TPA: metal-dependent hydrolase [Nitrospira sp.]|nr:metal-dependent hydrolase [Nitrospira sp.]
MASPLAHAVVAVTVAVGFHIPSVPIRYWLLGILCAEVPDFDVIGFWLGIPYESILGHRGLSHSLLFAALFSGMVAMWAGRWDSVPRARLWSYLFLATLSHGIMDALTTGGLGVAFFAPFDNTRYFFSFHPIRVTPLEPSLVMGPAGIAVLKSEALWVGFPCALFLLGWSLSRGRWNRTG